LSELNEETHGMRIMVRLVVAATLTGAVVMTTPVIRAADVVVHVHRHVQDDSAAIKGTVIAESVSDAGRSLSFPFPSPFISLPPGDWFLSARLPGDWSEPRLFSIREGPTVADLNTYPLARLTARITLDAGKEPHALRAYFHRVSMEDLDAPLEGNVACDVTKGTALCQLPRGEFDLAFRIPGFASRYVWNATLSPRGILNAGLLHFVAGSTLSGRVEIPQRRVARLDRVTVSARPVVIAGANEEQRYRNESARVTTHPTPRGFFALDLPPGEFTVQASYDDLISEDIKVKVTAGREVSLRQPLQLDPQRSVKVRVHPALDPWSKPWTIALAHVDDTGFLLSERSLKTSPDGSCRFANVLPGQHRVTVVRAVDQSWASESVDVDSEATIDLNIDVIRLTGSIHMGTKPLQALATLRSNKTGASVKFKTKADGTFAARLPAPEHDTWDEVEIKAEQPMMQRTLQQVRIQAHDDGAAELSLDLPVRFITGTVVDEFGRPAPQALIDVLSPDGSIQQIDSPDGSFTMMGLEAGRHRLRATTVERESIDLLDVVLSDDKDATADVVLPIAPVGHLRGVVRTLNGPAPGAALFATPPGEITRPIILSRVDPEGHFDLRFPAAASEVIVAINAPGYAFRLARTVVGNDEQTFAVEQNGGMLSVDVPPVRSGLRPYLTHNGAALPAVAAAYVAGATFGANLSQRVKFDIGSVEPGSYSLCWLADGRSTSTAPACITGVLPPHGTLTLAEESPTPNAR
jgi:hypothetical protein